MRLRRLAFAAVAAALSLSAASSASADERTDVDKGRAAYLAKNYDDADARFRAMLDPKSGTLRDPSYVAEARMFWGATLLAKERADEARDLFERLILAKPDYEPDVLQVPPTIVNFFFDVRSKLQQRLNDERLRAIKEKLEKERREKEAKERQAKRLKLLEEQAAEELVVERHSRLLALAPFGAGQFQNGDKTLGWVLLGGETALFLSGSILFPVYRVQLANANDAFLAGDSTRAQGWLDRANATRLANLITYGAFAVTAIAGVVQAQIAFVPEHVEKKTRPIPPAVSAVPLFGPLTTEGAVRGAFIGLGGTF